MNLQQKRKLLFFIAKLLFWVPDTIMLSIQYRVKVGHWPDLKTPQRYSEKLQLYKIQYHHQDMTRCVDKYLVRDFVIERLGTSDYLNELYQIHQTADEIDFDTLPDQFVIKTTDGGNGDNIFICRNKASIDVNKVVKEVNSWRNKKYYILSREWAYRGAANTKVVVEKYLEDDMNQDGSIDDYKFLCFDGKFRFLWIDKNRYSNHKRGFWNENLDFLDDVYSDWPTFEKEEIVLPSNIQQMIRFSEKLADGFPFARVDWYNIKGKIVFGEITFYPWSGYVKFTPDSFDFELGRYLNIQ